MKRSDVSFQLDRLANSQDSKLKHFVNSLARRKSDAIEHLPASADLIAQVWKNCAILVLLAKRNPRVRAAISCMPVSPRENKWTIFLDKLSTCSHTSPDTLHMTLFRTLLLESISREKGCLPYWTPACKELSERLWSPIATGSADSDLISSITLSPKQEAQSPFSTMTRTKVPSKSFPKTCSPSFTSFVAGRWESEATKTVRAMKAIRIKIIPNQNQRKILLEWMNTSNYVYNKTVEALQAGAKNNFIDLRDKLVTASTKKTNPEYLKLSHEIKEMRSERARLKKLLPRGENNIAVRDMGLRIADKNKSLREVAKTMNPAKNEGVFDWETETPKDVRAGAVHEACTATKSGWTNLKRGNIRHFRLKFKTKENPHKSIAISQQMFSINKDGDIVLAPEIFKNDKVFKIGKRQKKRIISSSGTLDVSHDAKLVKQHDAFYIMLSSSIATAPATVVTDRIAGIDPGVRTFMTCYSPHGVVEINHDSGLVKKLHDKIDSLKGFRLGRPLHRSRRNRHRKKAIMKHEHRLSNMIDELHWKSIRALLGEYDVLLYGDIKSQGIVRGSNIPRLNRIFNTLKFFKFKQRLMHKAAMLGKHVVLVNEAYTSQTCSHCGNIYKPGSSKVYSCTNSECGCTFDRDVNAAKNMLVKGIISLQ
jgi:putative transposase